MTSQLDLYAIHLLTQPVAGTVLGVALLVTFAISIAAIVQRNHVTIGLVILNWTLIIDAIAILVVGTFLWFFTLQERNNFHTVLSEQSSEIKIAIQDKACPLSLNGIVVTNNSCS